MYCNEDLKIFIYEKMINLLDKDERYSSVIPSFALMFLDYITDERAKKIIELFKKSILGLNPQTMNANYYRMFLRDGYKIAFRKDIEASILRDLNGILDTFLESYILYSNLLIPDNEKIEFLEYLLTNDLSEETSEKIFNLIKTQPNLNVKILINATVKPEQQYQTQLELKNVKCGSCLREISGFYVLDKKSCEICDIDLCITCFIEFEFSGENCPGSIFGNKTHKFKMKKL